MRLAELPQHLREKADQVLEDAAADQAARAYRRSAELLEEALQEVDLDRLTLEEAEAHGAYTRRHLARLVRDGVIPNASAPGEPITILRCHVPVKPGHRVASRPRLMPSSRVQAARAVASGGR